MLLLVCLVLACGELAIAPVEEPEEHHELPDDEIQLLGFRTYDGSGQVVHPDVVQLPANRAGPRRFLAITPYPGGDASKENPSIFGSEYADAWRVPDGLSNPVVRPEAGYLSDPDIVYEPEQGELWMYYREVRDRNIVRVVRSTDGVRWSAPSTVVSGANHSIVSPSVVRRARGDWLMWAVDANVGCTASATKVTLRRSTNGTDWSTPQTVTLEQSGLSVWHIDVQWIESRGEYWALYNAKNAGSCTTRAIFLATSVDGVTWKTYPSPVLTAGAIPVFEDIVYRSTFEYDPAADAITLWYSGARYESGWTWSSAVQRRSRLALFDEIARASPRSDKPFMSSVRRGVPELVNAP